MMPTRLLIVAVTVNAVLGQLFLKRALISLGGRAAFATIPKFIAGAVASPWIYASVSIQAFGYVLWMLLISREKLGVATASVGAGFYFFMPLCAWAVYGESLNSPQWLGIGLLTIGITFVGMGNQ
jgi:drug/metabolite transporter (DMT)-like permease